MKIQRSKNTVRNMAFGIIFKIITIIMPFVTRTMILYYLGADYLGLGSLFTSILSFLGLAELGFSQAMLFSMYEPIAKDNKSKICALLKLYKKYYRVIGFVILGIGLLLLPFLKYLIKGDTPEGINIYLLYLIFLFNTVISYFLFAYRGSLLSAHQRGDIDSKINTVIVIVQYALQFLVLLLFKNYYLYIILLPAATIATNLARLIVVKKMFPDYLPEGDLDKTTKQSITKRIKALVGAKLNTVVINSSDNIVMSAFLGLTTIAIYNNYYYIITALTGFITIIYGAMGAGVGNSIVVETREKNYKDFLKFSFLNAWIVGWCSICLICIYQPFMDLWTQGKLLFPFEIVALLVVYFYLFAIRRIPIVYKDAAGIWWEDRVRPYVCMAVNLISNIILVQVIGVAGIVISTILSLIISIIWENYTVFKYIFFVSSKEYYLKMGLYLFVTMLLCGITFLACNFLPWGFLGVLLRLGICLVLPNAIWILIFHNNKDFRAAIQLIGRAFHVGFLQKIS